MRATARRSALDAHSRRILVTGHTGFKGSWLCEWLVHSGARVSGIALPPGSPDTLFPLLRLEERIDNHILCDIRDFEKLSKAVRFADPEIIFHLAAQSLVRRSYHDPLLTWSTNLGGTANLLEAARALQRPVTVVIVTTDKVYKNREWEFAYREEDELGGHDPYSASKAACEIAVASWRSSFGSDAGVRVVTARAGNVIGGGDFNEDRIIPDCFRAWSTGRVVELRNPGATRPWQHVLEPLSGYMALAAHTHSGGPIHACNFGPGSGSVQTVQTLVETIASLAPSRRWTVARAPDLHEAHTLSLSIDRARYQLGWEPRMTFEENVAWTNEGYVISTDALPQLIERQIADFEAKKAVPSLAG